MRTVVNLFLFLCVGLMIFSSPTQANSPGAIGTRKAVGSPIFLDTSITNVTAAAWVQLIAATTDPCSQLILQNSGTSPIKLGVGAAAAEVDMGAALPMGGSLTLTQELRKGVRLSARALTGTQSAGMIVITCLQ